VPPPTVDRSLVLHVAKLASLSLTDNEADRLTSELGRILKYVDELAAVDTRDVPPTAHLRLETTPWRDDEPAPCLSNDEALAQAPQAEGGGFAVPTFVE